MKNRELPPRPDPDTGMPAPPEAPPHRGSKPAENGPGEPKVAPPDGHGPALAWHNPLWWKDGFRPAITYVLPVLAVFLIIKDRGFGWTTTYWWWLLLVGVSLLSVPYFRGRPFAAGAAWFRYGSTWVNTYELVSIRVVAYYGFYSLKLEDADGHRISLQTGTIQQNRSLWNLVYNGIVHSAYNGRLALDRITRATLEMPDLADVKPQLRSRVWSLLPFFSLGVLTPFVIGHGARRLRSRGLALGALAYAVPIPAFLVAAVFVPSSDAAIEWATAGLVSGLIIAWLPGGLHAYRLCWRISARPRAEAAREQMLARRTG
jgi:hypothetical protein